MTKGYNNRCSGKKSAVWLASRHSGRPLMVSVPPSMPDLTSLHFAVRGVAWNLDLGRGRSTIILSHYSISLLTQCFVLAELVTREQEMLTGLRVFNASAMMRLVTEAPTAGPRPRFVIHPNLSLMCHTGVLQVWYYSNDCFPVLFLGSGRKHRKYTTCGRTLCGGVRGDDRFHFFLGKWWEQKKCGNPIEGCAGLCTCCVPRNRCPDTKMPAMGRNTSRFKEFSPSCAYMCAETQKPIIVLYSVQYSIMPFLFFAFSMFVH